MRKCITSESTPAMVLAFATITPKMAIRSAARRRKLYSARQQHSHDAARLPHRCQRPRLHHILPVVPGGQPAIQATVDDPTLGWVAKTIPMLKELGQ